MCEEQELIQRCLRRDEQAWSLLVARYQAMVLTVIQRMVRGGDVVEDLAQEVFLRVFRGLASFRGHARLSTWIYQITYRVCLEELARARRCRSSSPLDAETRRGTLASPSAAAALAAVDSRQAVDYWLSRLPPAYRMALTLYYLQEQTYTEIAVAMELPLGTVKTYLHRGRRFLRGHLSEAEPGE